MTDSWHRLRLFNYFRASISLLLITIYFNNWLLQLAPSGFAHTELFIATAFAYLFASLIFITGIFYQKPGLEQQVFIQSIIDISCIILLMHATGGVRSGLGMLLIISTSMTSLFMQKRLAIMFAAIAALSVIAEQVYSQITFTDYTPAYSQAGLLGILIFISAFLTIYTAKKLRETEKLAEEQSSELETIVQMNEHIIKHMRTGILVVQNNGLILMANNAALELLGNITINVKANLKEVSLSLFKRFVEWNDNNAGTQQPIQQAQGLPDLQPGFSQIEKNSRHPENGRTLIFLEDASQLAQRFQQIKLASLGRLTASIAHEIRNPLSAINHAGQLLSETSADEADKKLTHIINTQANRLNSIVENVLQLSRQQRGTPEKIQLNEWLRNFRKEFVATHNLQDYQIQINVLPKDVIISFDTSQLHQAMWNLFSNAINHSKMSISNVMINIQGRIDTVFKQPYIDIIDNGPGIDAEAQPHIFDPFFTTSSEGTGLGLYLTKEVVENNRAKIRFIAPAAGGTCFRIYFQQVLQ
jgi:two-component system sensor histidine kinase PilS (NtrC family)